MTKITIIILLAAFAYTTVNAQEQQMQHKQVKNDYNPEKQIETFVKRLDLLLELTSDQKKAIEILQKEKIAEMEEFREKMKAQKEEMKQMHKEKMEMHKEMDSSIMELLDDKQRAKYSEWQSLNKQKKEMHKQHINNSSLKEKKGIE